MSAMWPAGSERIVGHSETGPKRQNPIGSAPACRARPTVRGRTGALSIGPFEGSRSGCSGSCRYAFSIDRWCPGLWWL